MLYNDINEGFPTAAQLAAAERARQARPRFEMSDKTVLQSTAADASSVKQAAITRGYYQDAFASLLSPAAGETDLTLRRGYALRARSMEAITRSFIQAHDGQCAVVVLGVGMDSLFFRLAADGVSAAAWLELDLVSNVADRAIAIDRAPALRSLLPGDAGDEITPLGVRTPAYTLRACDLSSGVYVQRVAESLPTGLPTIVLAECVLVYLLPEDTRAALQAVLEPAGAAPCALAVFEQSGQMDFYTHEMIRRLAERGVRLPGLEAARTPAEHEAQYAELLPHVRSQTLLDLWRNAAPSAQNAWRQLEPEAEDADERNFEDMAEHYSVLVAASAPGLAEQLMDAAMQGAVAP